MTIQPGGFHSHRGPTGFMAQLHAAARMISSSFQPVPQLAGADGLSMAMGPIGMSQLQMAGKPSSGINISARRQRFIDSTNDVLGLLEQYAHASHRLADKTRLIDILNNHGHGLAMDGEARLYAVHEDGRVQNIWRSDKNLEDGKYGIPHPPGGRMKEAIDRIKSIRQFQIFSVPHEIDPWLESGEADPHAQTTLVPIWMDAGNDHLTLPGFFAFRSRKHPSFLTEQSSDPNRLHIVDRRRGLIHLSIMMGGILSQSPEFQTAAPSWPGRFLSDSHTRPLGGLRAESIEAPSRLRPSVLNPICATLEEFFEANKWGIPRRLIRHHYAHADRLITLWDPQSPALPVGFGAVDFRGIDNFDNPLLPTLNMHIRAIFLSKTQRASGVSLSRLVAMMGHEALGKDDRVLVSFRSNREELLGYAERYLEPGSVFPADHAPSDLQRAQHLQVVRRVYGEEAIKTSSTSRAPYDPVTQIYRNAFRGLTLGPTDHGSPLAEMMRPHFQRHPEDGVVVFGLLTRSAAGYTDLIRRIEMEAMGTSAGK